MPIGNTFAHTAQKAGYISNDLFDVLLGPVSAGYACIAQHDVGKHVVY